MDLYDRTGTAVTHRVVGIYERSVDDGSKITVSVTMLYISTGWDMWILYKREYTGDDYPAALAIHNAGTGHEDYSSGYDFSSDASWVQYGNGETFRAYGIYADGSGHHPSQTQNGDILVTTIQP